MIIKEERIGGQRLILGNSLDVMPKLGAFDHLISDPPYEDFMHKAKSGSAGRKAYGSKRRIRTDGHANPKTLDFDSIDAIREPFVKSVQCDGWFIVFCTPEGVGRWADVINESPIKYKRACTWIKPDSTPQLNGQGPAMGAENFVCAWAGKGFAKWNAGGKRGVYKHTVNPPDRHGGHPTEKPWRLFVELLEDFTNPEQTILDPFMGSGTTLVACQKTGRKGTGIELNPEYFEIACKRVEESASQPDLFIQPPKQEPQQEAMELCQ